MNHIMLDLETLGNQPGCIVAAIGAVAFGGGQLGREFYVRVDVRDAERHGLTLNADTFVWWLTQSDAARLELSRSGAHPLTQALFEFGDFYASDTTVEGRPRAVWGNGSDFDNAILAAAYRAAQLPVPWSHLNNRCYRTLKNLHREVKIEIAESARHNALEDAKAQAAHLMRMRPEL